MVEKVLGKLDRDGVDPQGGIAVVISVLVAVHVGEQAAEKYQVPVGERFDTVSGEPGSRALDDVDDFVLVVEVPWVFEVVVVALLDFERRPAGKAQLLVHNFDLVFHGGGVDGFMQIYQQKMQKNHLFQGLLFSNFGYLL